MLLRRALPAVTLCLLLPVVSACPGRPGSDSGGITIPESDGTGPTLTLQAAATASGGESAAVSGGGSAQSMTLHAKTGHLNLAASAKDPESGIQSLEIWLIPTITRCEGDPCSVSQPEVRDPRFVSSVPQRSPGQQASEASIMLEALDLTAELTQTPPPGGSVTVEWRLSARAKNHLGTETRTPELKVTYRQTA
ncbi:hypothetical protein AB0M02_38555 [Actinoplanes sp. NPDC051861]|uniref:hypothetical protein n=1 Tax=Actinoplanes sp. NPDC051861 TaxID=3155170 RepID=UPI0034323239